MNPIINESISTLMFPRENYSGNWYENSQEGVGVLKDNWKNKDIILYANSFSTVNIRSVLVSSKEINKLDAERLSNLYIDEGKSWKIHNTYCENVLSDLSINPPLSGTIIENGEPLIFKRNFSHVKDYQPKFEISQKLVHSLDLYCNEENNSYYTRDSQGRKKKIITIYDNKETDYYKNLSVVTIRKSALEKYMSLSEMSLVTRFNFLRKRFPDIILDEIQSNTYKYTDLYYTNEIKSGQASYTYGYLVNHPNITKVDLINKMKEDEDNGNKKYQSFIIKDRKSGQIIESSCDPKCTANYFTESDLPFESSPAFFNPDVLLRYQKDSERYTINNRSIFCSGVWYLQLYDINEEGQVFTYLKYLADLPYKEQLHWKKYNEEPKA